MSTSKLPPIPEADKAKATDKMAKPISSIKKSVKKQNKTTLIRIALILLMIAGLIVPVVAIYLNNKATDKKTDASEIAVETENQEIKQLIKKALVYSRTGVSTYYSPSLDATFKLDGEQLSTTENSTYVSFYARSTQDLYGSLRVMSTDPLDFMKTQNKFRDDFKVKEIKQDANAKYQIAGYTYTRKPLLKGEKTETYEGTVYYKKIDNTSEYVYLEYKYIKGVELPKKLQKQLEELITTFEYKPENISAEATVALTDFDMQLSFDKKTWELYSTTDRSISLNLHNDNYSQPNVTVVLRGDDIYPSTKMDTLLVDQAKYETDYLKEMDKKVVYSDKGSEVDLAGGKAYKIAYSYSNEYQTDYVTSYFALSPNKDFYYRLQTRIVVYSGSKGGADTAKKELEAVLKGLKFEKDATAKKTTTSAPITNFDKVLGADTLNIEKPALLGKLGTIHIANTICSSFQINDPLNLPRTSQKKFEYCSASYGTGFIVSPDGYIITNAHVGSGNPYDNSTRLFTNSRSVLFRSVAEELAYAIEQRYPGALETQAGMQKLLEITREYIYTLLGKEKIKISNVEYSNYMEKDKPFEFDINTMKLKNPSDYIKLDVVDANKRPSFILHATKNMIEKKTSKENPLESDTPDLALLKISSPSGKYPTLALGNMNTLTEGEALLAIGFPGAADDRVIFSETSSTSATITRGIISAIKGNTNNKYKLIQTDAVINHGNSGGPMINNNSKVIGVSTYILSSDETDNYGAGVTVDAIKEILSRNNIKAENSSISDSVLAGMDNMQKGYYTWALRNFDEAIKAYPSSVEVVKPLKLLAQEKIDAGEDNSPIATYGDFYIHPSDMPYIFGGLGIAIVILLIMIISAIVKKPKRARRNAQPIAPQQLGQVPTTAAPMPGMRPQTPPAPSPLPTQPRPAMPVTPQPVTPRPVQPPAAVTPTTTQAPVPTTATVQQPRPFSVESAMKAPTQAMPVNASQGVPSTNMNPTAPVVSAP